MHHPRFVLPLIAALAVVAGCSGDTDDTASTTTTTSTTSEAATSGTAPALPQTIPNDSPRVRLADRLVRSWEIPGQADWIAEVDGVMWLKRDDGTVSAITASSSKPIANIPTGYSSVPACQGLIYDGKRLWTCAGENALVTIDPATERRGDQVRVRRLGDQSRFVVSQDQIWVIDSSATKLSGLALEDGSVQTQIELGTFCTDLARQSLDSPPMLYVVCPSDGLVLAVDLVSSQVVDELQLEDPRVAAVGEDLWVGFDGGLAQIATSDLSVTAVYDVPPGLTGGVFVTPDAVWVRAEGQNLLTRIDPASHSVVETITTDQDNSAGDLLVDSKSVWTTASDDEVLYQVAIRG